MKVKIPCEEYSRELKSANEICRLERALSFPTMYYSYGNQALVENTAVGGLAFLADGRFTPAESAASWVAESRQGSWGYGTTQSTVQSLRLLNSISLGPAVNEDLTVSVHYDGRFFADETISVESADVMRQFDLSNLLEKGDHTLEISAEREERHEAFHEP